MKNFIKKLLPFKTSNSGEEELISSGEEMILLSSDTSYAMRMAFWIIGVGFGGFVLWAIFAPLDEGATSAGTVTVEFHRRAIQHMTGGVVQEILVREGESVKEGQVLILLNQTTARSQMQINQHQADYFSQQIKKLKPMAEEGYYPQQSFQDLLRQRDESLLKAQVAKEELERTEIKSPISGRVMGISVTMGGVVSPGQKIMEVVPNDDGMVVEAKIAPHLIDRIHPGLLAQVRFSALNQRTTPVVDGRVEWVSADKFTATDQSQIMRFPEGYYIAKVSLNADELKKLGDQQLYPGMPADVIVKLGRRTFMSYLTKPFTDRAAMSLKER